MHDRRREIEARLARALAERLQPAIHTTIAPLTVEVWHVPRAADGRVGEPVSFSVARDAAYRPVAVGGRTTRGVLDHESELGPDDPRRYVHNHRAGVAPGYATLTWMTG